MRRDNCGLVRYVIYTNLRKILIDRDVKGSIEFTKNMIRELLQNKIDLSLLIITKQLKEDYTNMQPHAVLADKMRKRDPSTAPNIGDRVPYVIVRGDKCTSYSHASQSGQQVRSGQGLFVGPRLATLICFNLH